jgi:hypothetical protein
MLMRNGSGFVGQPRCEDVTHSASRSVASAIDVRRTGFHAPAGNIARHLVCELGTSPISAVIHDIALQMRRRYALDERVTLSSFAFGGRRRLWLSRPGARFPMLPSVRFPRPTQPDCAVTRSAAA